MPFRPHWIPKTAATPKFCEKCHPRKGGKKRQRFEDAETGQINAQKWAEHQYAMAGAEAYDEWRYRERYRGMLRSEPWLPQARIPSFVWDLAEPTHTLVTEYRRGIRFLKTNW